MAKRRQLTKEDKLRQLRGIQAEFDKEESRSGGGGRYLFFNEGDSFVVRFLQPVGEMGDRIHQLVATHYIKPYPSAKKYTTIRCNALTSGNVESCPVCELREMLQQGSAEEKAIADSLKPDKKYCFNVVVRPDGFAPQDEEEYCGYLGPKILRAGFFLWQDIKAAASNPSWPSKRLAREGVAIWDDYEGLDFRILREGSGRDTKYHLHPEFGDPMTIGPLLANEDGKPDEEGMDEIYKHVPDLTPVMMPLDGGGDGANDKAFLATLDNDRPIRMYPYDRNVEKYGLAPTQECLENLDEIIEAIVSQGNDDNDNGDDEEKTEPVRSGEVGERLQRRRR